MQEKEKKYKVIFDQIEVSATYLFALSSTGEIWRMKSDEEGWELIPSPEVKQAKPKRVPKSKRIPIVTLP